MAIKDTLKANSPYISFGVGIVSGIAALAFAIRATTKLPKVFDEYDMGLSDINETYENEIESSEEIPEETVTALAKNRDHHIMTLKIKTFGKVVLLYLPTLGSIGLSWGAFGYSVGTLRGRVLGATAALDGVTGAFEAYRQRWIDEVGPEKERAVYLGLPTEKITVEEEDPQTGKVKKVKKEVLSGSAAGALYSYPWKQGVTTQWDRSPVMGYDAILGVLRFQQQKLDGAIGGEAKKLSLVKLLEELGYTPGENENISEYEEYMAGWLPGDVISVGFKDGHGNTPDGILTKEEYEFLAGVSPDVTLVFNCRPDILSKKSARDKNEIVFTPDESLLIEAEGGEANE